MNRARRAVEANQCVHHCLKCTRHPHPALSHNRMWERGKKKSEAQGSREMVPSPDLAADCGYTRASDADDTSSALSRSKISLARERASLFSEWTEIRMLPSFTLPS